jgi:hypothetical protein
MQKRRPAKPNPTIEAILHRRPVDGMIDGILLNEMKQIAERKEFAAAERVALQISWYLHAVVAQKVQKL